MAMNDPRISLRKEACHAAHPPLDQENVNTRRGFNWCFPPTALMAARMKSSVANLLFATLSWRVGQMACWSGVHFTATHWAARKSAGTDCL